jgi:hypothetical protein
LTNTLLCISCLSCACHKPHPSHPNNTGEEYELRSPSIILHVVLYDNTVLGNTWNWEDNVTGSWEKLHNSGTVWGHRLREPGHPDTKFCMMVPNICGSSVLNLCHTIFLGPRILRWLLDFLKTCAPLSYTTHRCQCKGIWTMAETVYQRSRALADEMTKEGWKNQTLCYTSRETMPQTIT